MDRYRYICDAINEVIFYRYISFSRLFRNLSRLATWCYTWVSSLLRQCRAAKVPFFFKQWGEVRKDLTGRALNGRICDEMPRGLLTA